MWPGLSLHRGLDRALLAAASLLSQIAYLAVLPISIEGDALGYYSFARFLAGDPHGLFIVQHPVGYPAFLLATGATWLGSFDLTIAAQALMGILGPLLLYETLRGISRPAALATAFVYIISGLPYSYAKLLITEQLYVFCVLVTAAAVSRFIAAKRPGYAILAVGSTTAAVFVRNEALYLGLLAVVIMAVAAWPRWRRLRALALSVCVSFAVVIAWSAGRAAILGDRALVGSFSNYYGHTLFYRTYLTLGVPVRFWICAIGHSRDLICGYDSIPLVLPENGPATRQLAEIVGEWASTGGQDRFPGQSPQRILQDFFAKPTEAPPFDRYNLASQLAVGRLGYLKGDALLGKVATEALRAHPLAFCMMAAGMAPYFGISFENAANYLMLGQVTGPIVFANWAEDGYETQPYRPDFVRPYLSPELFREYRDSAATPMTPAQQALLRIGRAAHNIVRNGVGLLVLAAWPLLLWARNRALSVLLLGFFGLMLGTYTLSSGYSTRFEHVMMPIMLMIVALAVDTLVRLFKRRRSRRQGW